MFGTEAFVADDAEETVPALGVTGVLLFGPFFVTGSEFRQDPLFFFFAQVRVLVQLFRELGKIFSVQVLPESIAGLFLFLHMTKDGILPSLGLKALQRPEKFFSFLFLLFPEGFDLLTA